MLPEHGFRDAIRKKIFFMLGKRVSFLLKLQGYHITIWGINSLIFLGMHQAPGLWVVLVLRPQICALSRLHPWTTLGKHSNKDKNRKLFASRLSQ